MLLRYSWQHESFQGRLKSGMLTAHLYTPDITRWRRLLDELVDGQLKGVSAFRLVVGGPFFYPKQVPPLASDCGGFGSANDSGPTNDTSHAQQMKLYKQELRKRPLQEMYIPSQLI